MIVDVGAVVGHRPGAVPVAVEGQRHLGPQQLAQAVGVAGALLEHVRRRVRIDPDQPQDRPPLNLLPAKAAEMVGEEIGIAFSGHFTPWP